MKRAAWILKMAGLPLNCSYPLCSDERSCWVRMIMENVIFASSDRTMGVRLHHVHRFTIVPWFKDTLIVRVLISASNLFSLMSLPGTVLLNVMILWWHTDDFNRRSSLVYVYAFLAAILPYAFVRLIRSIEWQTGKRYPCDLDHSLYWLYCSICLGPADDRYLSIYHQLNDRRTDFYYLVVLPWVDFLGSTLRVSSCRRYVLSSLFLSVHLVSSVFAHTASWKYKLYWFELCWL